MTSRNQTPYPLRSAGLLPAPSSYVDGIPSLSPLQGIPMDGVLYHGGGYYPYPDDPYASHNWRGNYYNDDWWGNRRRYGPYDPDPGWGRFWMGVACTLILVLFVVYHLFVKN